ncbi:MAG: glycosyltransferase family 39 protein, partial [Bacteroidia bacterium]|nr:glycosyltransferase family 39 protein [Bacteroidia bacterium]
MKLTIQRLMVEALLVIGVTIALFHGLGMMPLSADEPIRALVAADMAINGNYIAPKLNGEVYLNKPPLYNWMLLGFFKVFNSYSEWVVRLPSILSLLAWGITIAVLVGRRLSNYHFGLVV